VNWDGERILLEKIPGNVTRHEIKPGLTRVAQVYAPRDVPRRYKFRYDLIYIQNQSFYFDIKLIALSIWITIRGRWENSGRKF